MEEVAKMGQRTSLDRFLDAPYGVDAANEKSLLRYLGVAS